MPNGKARDAASGSAAASAKFIGRRALGLQPARPRFILLALLFAECHNAFSRSWRDCVTFRPLQDRVLIRRVEEEEKTKGGIIIPDTAKEKPMEGEVLAAGPGTRGEDGKLPRSTSRSATGFCLANGRRPRSRSTARISSS